MTDIKLPIKKDYKLKLLWIIRKIKRKGQKDFYSDCLMNDYYLFYFYYIFDINENEYNSKYINLSYKNTFIIFYIYKWMI